MIAGTKFCVFGEISNISTHKWVMVCSACVELENSLNTVRKSFNFRKDHFVEKQI